MLKLCLDLDLHTYLACVRSQCLALEKLLCPRGMPDTTSTVCRLERSGSGGYVVPPSQLLAGGVSGGQSIQLVDPRQWGLVLQPGGRKLSLTWWLMMPLYPLRIDCILMKCPLKNYQFGARSLMTFGLWITSNRVRRRLWVLFGLTRLNRPGFRGECSPTWRSRLMQGRVRRFKGILFILKIIGLEFPLKNGVICFKLHSRCSCKSRFI